ncbi:EAL domain-containing protein [Comamonas sp. GB3 AK4-5]|uniref:EAL domain-containing protein n=1 Tax=Comamonas sp. GB3 AK4-5 TaxID=3231487 RepID=UPI00351E31EF
MLVACVQLVLATASIQLLSGVRTLVAGESIWSRAQMDAIFYLDRYASQGNEETYQQFRRALEAPLGDRLARQALDQAPVNLQQAREGLLRGGNHPDDIGTAITVLRATWNMEWMRSTIALWRAADSYLDQMISLAAEIHHARTQSGHPIDTLQVQAWQMEIDQIRNSTAPLTKAFSESLGVHSRTITNTLLVIHLSAAALLVLLVTLSLHRMQTRSHSTESALHSERERGFSTLAALGDGVLTLHSDGTVLDANPAAESLLGMRSDQILGQPLEKVLSFEHSEREGRDPVFIRLRESAHPFRDETVRWIRRSTDQQKLAVKLMGSPIHHDGRLSGAVLVLHDVTREQNFMHQLSWQADHDALTGLENRGGFRSRLEQLLSTPRNLMRPATLLHLNLDQFKLINDSNGYAAGDEVLREVCQCINRSIQDGDAVARLGGDEFAVLLHNCDAEQGMGIAEQLRQGIQQLHLQWGSRLLRTGVSIGMVHITAADACAQDLLRMADMACLRAKEMGRNKVFVYEHEDHAFKHYMGEMDWVERVRAALEQNRFCLFAQTLAPLQTGEEQGVHFEVLLRMLDPHGQIVPPGHFIPAAERYGLMPALDRWVITQAMRTLARFPKQMHQVHSCAINLSGTSLGDPSLLGFIQQQIAEFQIPAEILCFEITETSAIANMDNAVRLMAELQKQGCRFSLDDFGAGMSSFNYLKRLPVDYLKIDGGFVCDMLSNTSNYAMVEMINQIGHMMGKRTVAEFVEDEATITALQKMGVDYGQGYCIAKPMPWNFEYFSASVTLAAQRFGARAQAELRTTSRLA